MLGTSLALATPVTTSLQQTCTTYQRHKATGTGIESTLDTTGPKNSQHSANKPVHIKFVSEAIVNTEPTKSKVSTNKMEKTANVKSNISPRYDT